ncbi:MAG: UDP-4-amino-4,6-dideoxy-N-acetyl-beta-L-altrosamine transaminase [Bacteroidales bacterium]|jgi:UDP-4-amino-4,6-dideoxy-N-acetyl-beta-L-altrosamine transaminase|nr:UDP-4-amino-4,6-dideoxy-N-acetyl-beta-L-altrosamine transaminase [Bacteroidales bacterium]
MQPIPYGRQNITAEDLRSIMDTLQSDFLTQGPKILEFERDFAQYVNAQYAVAVSNGTAALHLSTIALDVQPDDNVIVTPLTFVASANCVRYCKGNVVFCDIDKHNYLLDLEKLEQLLSAKPKGYYKGVIPVDYAGYPVHGEKLRKIANEYGLWIIEDACHAPGAYFIDSKGEKQLVGNGKFAELTCFSFHPVKHIATGEGGMITANSKELYERLLLLRTHGITKDSEILQENHGGWYYEMHKLGYNYRLTDFQAALGISQLKRAEEGLYRRQKIANHYNEAFQNISGIITPKVKNDFYHAYHLYVIQVKDRLGLYDHLRNNNILVQVHYEPVHLQPYYKELGNKFGDMPVTEEFYSHCLSLPMYPTLTDEEQEYVIKKVLDFVKDKK